MSTEDFQSFMFHFRCPLCAASPKRVLLRDYLHRWSTASPQRLYSLLGIVGGALAEVRTGEARWLTKKFAKAAERLEGTLRFDSSLTLNSHLSNSGHSSLFFSADCPVCHTPTGSRKPDHYFTDWPHACKVQTGNILYETGLILWSILLGLPSWASGSFLHQINAIRLELRRTGQSMSLLECPQCGRFTSCRYGSEHEGFCRWCFDMGGGFGLSFSIDPDPDPDGPLIQIKKMQPDYTAPAKNVWDILPPEITQRLNA